MIVQSVGLSKSTPTKGLFSNVSFVINKGDKIGLVGPNGCGKSTLLRIITGEESQDSGTLVTGQGVILSYLPQEITPGYIEKCFKKLNEALTGEIAKNERRFAEVMDGLDLWEIICTPDPILSGGQRTKIALATSLVFDTDLLILDEPTNFLDLMSILWLEKFLAESDITLLVASHDRSFLDEVVGSIYSMGTDGLHHYEGGYTDFAETVRREAERQASLYAVQERTRKRLKEDIRETKEQARSTERATRDDHSRRLAKKVAKKAKSRETRLDKMLLGDSWVDKPMDKKVVYVEFSSDIKDGQTVVRAEHLSFTYTPFSSILFDANFSVRAGEKIAILGNNGTGKTTLLKLVAGELQPSAGSIWVNPSSTIGYFSQDLDNLDREKTVLAVASEESRLPQDIIRKTLGGLLFGNEMMSQKVKSLSLGERTRLGIAVQILKQPDLLILDEFCAHLDIDSTIRVQESLEEYRGAVLLVSHDRQLLDALGVSCYLTLSDHALSVLYGGLEEYRQITQRLKEGGV